MVTNTWKSMKQNAEQWIHEASQLIKASFHTSLNIDYKKSPNDLVTNVDKNTETFLIEKIRQHYPEHHILGEEGHGHGLDSMSGIVWVIDPIDGTMNFVHQQCNFAISIGIFLDGIGKLGLIYDVTRDELFHCIKGQGAYLNDKKLSQRQPVAVDKAVIDFSASWLADHPHIDTSVLISLVDDLRGTRSYGTAAIALAYVAAGRLDGYLSMHLAPWDVAAGQILIAEVGGKTTRIDGRSIDKLQSGPILAAESYLHEVIFSQYLQNAISTSNFS